MNEIEEDRRSWLLLASAMVAATVAFARYSIEQPHFFLAADAQIGIAAWASTIMCTVLFVLLTTGLYHLASGLLNRHWLNVLVGAVTVCLLLYWTGMVILKVQSDTLALTDAKSPETTAERLTELADYETYYFGYELDNRVASNPNTPPEILRKLYARGNLGTLVSLAENPQTPRGILEQLALHPQEYIQEGLSRNLAWK